MKHEITVRVNNDGDRNTVIDTMQKVRLQNGSHPEILLRAMAEVPAIEAKPVAVEELPHHKLLDREPRITIMKIMADGKPHAVADLSDVVRRHGYGKTAAEYNMRLLAEAGLIVKVSQGTQPSVYRKV